MANDVIRVIEVDEDDVWSCKSEREEKGDLFSIKEQMGTVQLDLSKSLERSDNEPTDHLLISAPTTKQVMTYMGGKPGDVRKELNFIGAVLSRD